MYCKSVSIENFRNIKSADVSFTQGTNIVLGSNGQGKTNLIEAIGMAALSRSFRSAKDAEMVNFNSDSAMIDLKFHRMNRNRDIKIKLYKNKPRSVSMDHLKLDALSELYGNFNTVIFCPEHLSIVKEGPSVRRNFLDMAISQVDPTYLDSLKKYRKLLLGRNKLIKDAKVTGYEFDDLVEVMSDQMAYEAAFVSYIRSAYVVKCESNLRKYFSEMTNGNEIPSLKYKNNVSDDHALFEDFHAIKRKYYRLYTESHKRELEVGCTLYGIHRDDMEIYLNGKPAREFASQGQQRTLALALKLSESDINFGVYRDYPVLLFDDVLSELDSSRRDYLLSRIKEKQVIMTGCEDKVSGDDVNIITVSGGVYKDNKPERKLFGF